MSDDFQIFSVANTEAILQEIDAGLKRNDIALSYAMAMRSASAGEDNPDWTAINRAIIDRWSFSGLEYIKVRAHKILAGKVVPT